MTDEETAGGMGEPHWFMAYSHALQRMCEAAHRRKWEWPWGEALDVRASPLVRTFWHKTGADLTVASLKLLGAHSQGPILAEGKCPTAHVITYLDEVAVHVPSLDAWDQLVWPTTWKNGCQLRLPPEASILLAASSPQPPPFHLITWHVGECGVWKSSSHASSLSREALAISPPEWLDRA